RAARLARRILWLGALVLCVPFAGCGADEWEKARQYHKDRRQTTGTVTAKSTQHVPGKGGGRADYLVDFRFNDEGGNRYTGRARVSAERYAELKPGSAVPVIYQETDPSQVQWLYDDADQRRALRRAWQGTLVGLSAVLLIVALLE